MILKFINFELFANVFFGLRWQRSTKVYIEVFYYKKSRKIKNNYLM